MTERAIKTTQHYSDEWTAEEDEWDLGDPVGYGKTEASAVQDLREQIADRTNRLKSDVGAEVSSGEK